MKLFTIGFTQTTAEAFFGKLRDAGVLRVVDTRIHRDGQLSGFAKYPDLPYFLSQLTNSTYEQRIELAPTPAMLKAYRDKQLSWDEYAESYRQLLLDRKPEQNLEFANLQHACLLCSEHKPDKCHRRLAAEYLRDAVSACADLQIIHL
jgi:uncharacterized protein (DUF488 family)